MTAYHGQTRTTLGQLCAALWDSQAQPDVIGTGLEPGNIVMPLALRCSALDRCATWESKSCLKRLSEISVCFGGMEFFPAWCHHQMVNWLLDQ